MRLLPSIGTWLGMRPHRPWAPTGEGINVTEEQPNDQVKQLEKALRIQKAELSALRASTYKANPLAVLRSGLYYQRADNAGGASSSAQTGAVYERLAELQDALHVLELRKTELLSLGCATNPDTASAIAKLRTGSYGKATQTDFDSPEMQKPQEESIGELALAVAGSRPGCFGRTMMPMPNDKVKELEAAMRAHAFSLASLRGLASKASPRLAALRTREERQYQHRNLTDLEFPPVEGDDDEQVVEDEAHRFHDRLQDSLKAQQQELRQRWTEVEDHRKTLQEAREDADSKEHLTKAKGRLDDQRKYLEKISDTLAASGDAYEWSHPKKHKLTGWPKLPPLLTARAVGEDDQSDQRKAQPQLTRYFHKTTRFRTTLVLEESVLNWELIKHTEVLKGLSHKFLQELFKNEGCLRAIVCMPNREVVTQGDWADFMGVIAKGEADVLQDGALVGRIKEGETFGQKSFIGVNQRRRATVKAATFCDVRLFYSEAWQRCVEKVPSLFSELKKCQAAWRTLPEDQALKATRRYTQKWARMMDPPPVY